MYENFKFTTCCVYTWLKGWVNAVNGDSLNRSYKCLLKLMRFEFEFEWGNTLQPPGEKSKRKTCFWIKLTELSLILQFLRKKNWIPAAPIPKVQMKTTRDAVCKFRRLSNLYVSLRISVYTHNTNTSIHIGSYLKKQYHALAKCFEIIYIVQSTLVFDMHKKWHPEYGKYEHHKEKKQTNVE